jgi:hypothetical protein
MNSENDEEANIDSRPSSNKSSQNADDINLIVIPTPRKKLIPHYAKPLQRSIKVAPMTTSTSKESIKSNSSTSRTPEAYIFGDEYASKSDKQILK